MHSQPPKSPTPLIRGERQRRRSPNPPPPYQGESPCQGSCRGTLETSRRSELLVNVYLFLAFTKDRSHVGNNNILSLFLSTTLGDRLGLFSFRFSPRPSRKSGSEDPSYTDVCRDSEIPLRSESFQPTGERNVPRKG